jgi:hypothetical protein
VDLLSKSPEQDQLEACICVTTVPTFQSLGSLLTLPVTGRGLVITAQMVQPRCRLDSFQIQLQPSRMVLTARCYVLLFRLLLVGLVIRSHHSNASLQFPNDFSLIISQRLPMLIVFLLSQFQFQ